MAVCGRAARSHIGWPANSAWPKLACSVDGKRSRRLAGRSSRRVPGTRRPQAPRRKRFIKKLADTVAEEATKHPDKPIEVWATDEHRLGLKPIHRRVWAPIGERPIALGHHRYEWLYVTGLVAPASGETVWATSCTTKTSPSRSPSAAGLSMVHFFQSSFIGSACIALTRLLHI